ncbi:damage-control phosphatase [Archaeoglobus neptunius]|uniref:damage-control phosphatase n=1 Tax=Archaeoglobus neptunius TaxID=2798580 RepID=UPI0019253B09|nr:damage-control phosphatase [Archaeoglobus neptunius]
MKISPLCPSCLLSRVYFEARLVTDDDELISKCVDNSLKILSKNFSKRPVNAHLATRIHREVYEILGVEDPYAQVKNRANRVAKEVLHVAEKTVRESDNPFKTAVIISIIGNNFDYGVSGHRVVEMNFHEFLTKKLEEGLAVDDVEKLEDFCSGKVVYLTDNAGEIFFDTLLMKEIKKRSSRLTVVVRGRPIISDATIEDAKLAGVDKIADEILTNGKGAIGIIREELPKRTLDRLEEADIIVAKGMANYECLSNSEFRPIAFLLTAKCHPVAKDIGVKVGEMVAKVVK